jgi:hypothetical protein
MESQNFDWFWEYKLREKILQNPSVHKWLGNHSDWSR